MVEGKGGDESAEGGSVHDGKINSTYGVTDINIPDFHQKQYVVTLPEIHVLPR